MASHQTTDAIGSPTVKVEVEQFDSLAPLPNDMLKTTTTTTTSPTVVVGDDGAAASAPPQSPGGLSQGKPKHARFSINRMRSTSTNSGDIEDTDKKEKHARFSVANVTQARLYFPPTSYNSSKMSRDTLMGTIF